MGTYSYKAIDQDGLLKRGTTEADTIEAVYSDLSVQGLNVLNVSETSRLMTGFARGFISWRVNRNEITEFASNLSVIMKAGIPILDALEDINQTVDNKYLKKAIDDIKERIRMGMSFSSALNQHKEIFPDIFRRLVTVGEETGRLETSVSEVAEHLQRMEDLSRMVKRALMYPVFAVTVTMGAMVFWLVYVLPKVMTIMKDMGVKLPFVTKILFVGSNFCRDKWYVLLIIPLIIFIVVKLSKQKGNTRYYLDLFKIKFPLIKQFVFNRLLAVLSEQLRILIAAGITIDRSLVIVANAINSEVFKKMLLNTRDLIMTGSKISDAMRQQKIFPPLVLRMVDIGETSGNLDNQFNFLANYYFKKLEDISDKLGKMIEPIMIAFVGGIFAIIIIGLLLPVYDVVTKFDKGF